MINNNVRFKELSEETREVEEMISDFFTGKLARDIKDLEKEIKELKQNHDTLCGVNYNNTKIQNSKIADLTGERVIKNEEKIIKLNMELQKLIEKKIIMSAFIEERFITAQEETFLKNLYAYNLSLKRAAQNAKLSRYKAKKAREKLVKEIAIFYK